MPGKGGVLESLPSFSSGTAFPSTRFPLSPHGLSNKFGKGLIIHARRRETLSLWTSFMELIGDAGDTGLRVNAAIFPTNRKISRPYGLRPNPAPETSPSLSMAASTSVAAFPLSRYPQEF